MSGVPPGSDEPAVVLELRLEHRPRVYVVAALDVDEERLRLWAASQLGHAIDALAAWSGVATGMAA